MIAVHAIRCNRIGKIAIRPAVAEKFDHV
jgi:hypothetical protein